jgi:hypothetical protein
LGLVTSAKAEVQSERDLNAMLIALADAIGKEFVTSSGNPALAVPLEAQPIIALADQPKPAMRTLGRPAT